MGYDFILNSLKKNYSLSSRICENASKMRNKNMRNIFCQKNNKDLKLEEVATIEGVRYIDNSASTTPNSTWTVLEELKGCGDIVLVTGGNPDHLDYSPIKSFVKDLKALIILGEGNESLEKLAEFDYPKKVEFIKIPNKIKEIVLFLRYYTKKGDIVLFSPGCENPNYSQTSKHKENKFKKAVKSW